MSNESAKDDTEDDFDFKHKGKVDDEVTLQFDDETAYYVSSNFLKMSSPVFRRMLESDFREKTSGMVEFKKKDPNAFLKLLYCLHPSKQEKVTEETVFAIIPLAEEYEVKSVIARCKGVLASIIAKVGAGYALNEYVDSSSTSNYLPQSRHTSQCYGDLSKCFQVLRIAELYGYSDIEETVSKVVSRFPSSMYLKRRNYPDSYEHYDKLSTETQKMILMKRLQLYDIQDKVPKKRPQEK